MIVAFGLRFYRLGEVPVSLDWDEAAIGYNAYSLLHTGRDEFGKFLPVVFRSFDDYKPPLYFYLTVPSVLVFGLNEFAVRFPSSFFGTLTVYITYLFVSKLLEFGMVKRENTFKYLPLVTAGLLAISPWHIHFSRIGFEANTGVFLNVLGAYLFLKGIQKGWWLVLSSFVFSLSLYEYHSERVFAPLLVIAFSILFRKELIKKGWITIVSIILGIIMVVPLIFLLFNPSNLIRLTGTSSISDQTRLLARNVVKLEDAKKNGDIIGTIFANRRITYGQILLNGYLSHFNFNWLFITGDQERHKAPGMGLLYWWELPFLLIGLYILAASPLFSKRMKLTIFSWFLLSPIAASPTTELPHAIRTLVFLPTFQIFVSIGLLAAWNYLQTENQYMRKGIYIVLSVFMLFNFVYYMNNYYIQMNREYSKYWQYGYKQAVAYASENYEKYDHIVVSTKLEQPHIFFLFYLKYPPEKYLQQGGTYSGGFAEERNKFEKYEFRKFTIDSEHLSGKTLYIGTPSEIPEGGLYTIYYLDGTEAIQFYEK